MRQSKLRSLVLDRIRRHRTTVLNRVLRDRVPPLDGPPERYELVRWWQPAKHDPREAPHPPHEWTEHPGGKRRYQHMRPDQPLGRYIPDDEIEDGEYFDGGATEDYEDPRRARIPSDYGS